jgi:hypothetical protein
VAASDNCRAGASAGCSARPIVRPRTADGLSLRWCGERGLGRLASAELAGALGFGVDARNGRVRQRSCRAHRGTTGNTDRPDADLPRSCTGLKARARRFASDDWRWSLKWCQIRAGSGTTNAAMRSLRLTGRLRALPDARRSKGSGASAAPGLALVDLCRFMRRDHAAAVKRESARAHGTYPRGVGILAPFHGALRRSAPTPNAMAQIGNRHGLSTTH